MPSLSLTDGRLDLSSLRSKLPLGQTGDALLKFVQAGVGGGGQAIRINLLGWESVIRVEAPLPEVLELEALRAHLLNPEGFPDSPLLDLAIGVLASAYHEEIRVTTHTHFLHLTRFEEKFRRRNQPDSVPALEIRLRRGPKSQYLGHLPTRITEHQVILSRCSYAPLPLFLDGIRVSGRKNPFQHVHLGQRHWTCASGGFSLRRPYTAFETRAGSRVRHHPTKEEPQCALLLESDGKEDAPCSLAVCLPQDFSGAASVTFIKRGVALESMLLPGTMAGVQVMSDGDLLRTGLADFRVHQGETLQRLLAEARQGVQETAESVLKLYEDEDTSIEWQADSALVRAKFLMGGAGVLVGWTLGMLVGLPTLLVGPLGAYLGVQIASAGDSPEPRFLSRKTLDDKRSKLRNAMRVSAAEPTPVDQGVLEFDEEDDDEDWTESR